MDWPAGTLPYQLPFTLGHETAGTVAALGAGARGVAEGDRVLVYALGLWHLLGAACRDGEWLPADRRGAGRSRWRRRA